jgi:hypothetical protein
MKAIVQNDYGTPDVLRLAEIAQPAMKDNHVLVRVKAVSINAGDVFAMRGNPWPIRFIAGFPKPKNYILGWDMAGVVEAAGSSVTQFGPGDEVYAACSGALAEYVSVAEDKLALKPANLTFEQAAAIPTGAITALKGLRDVGKLQPGQKVLINGASGGVGTFAVQIAKALGAEVTGVCSTRNVDMVRPRRDDVGITPEGLHPKRTALRPDPRQCRQPFLFRPHARHPPTGVDRPQQRSQRHGIRVQGVFALAVPAPTGECVFRCAEWQRPDGIKRVDRNRESQAGR